MMKSRTGASERRLDLRIIPVPSIEQALEFAEQLQRSYPDHSKMLNAEFCSEQQLAQLSKLEGELFAVRSAMPMAARLLSELSGFRNGGCGTIQDLQDRLLCAVADLWESFVINRICKCALDLQREYAENRALTPSYTELLSQIEEYEGFTGGRPTHIIFSPREAVTSTGVE